MASITTMPTELVLAILDELEYASQVSAVSLTCRRLYGIASDYLYEHYAKTYSPHGLHRVIENGNDDAVYQLLLAGIEFDTAYYLDGSPFKSPLRVAASNGHVHILDTFANFFGNSIVTVCADELARDAIDNGHRAVLDYLAWLGATLDQPDPYTLRCNLSYAAEKGQLECVKLLVEIDRSYNVRDVFEQTPLWWACKEGHLDVVKFLVEECCADPELSSIEPPHAAPIYCAALAGHKEVVQYLLDKGAHPSFVMNLNIKALAKLAVKEMGQKDTILPLLWERIDVINAAGWVSPEGRYYFLMCAAADGNVDIVRELLRWDYQAVYEYDICTPCHIAASHGHVDIVRAFLSRMDDFDTQDDARVALTQGMSDRNEKVVEACIRGYSPQYLRNLGATAVIGVMPFPALCDYIFGQKVLRKLDEDEDTQTILTHAIRHANLRALGFLLRWGRRDHQWDPVGYLEQCCVDDGNRRMFNLLEYAGSVGRVDSFNYILYRRWKKPNPADKKRKLPDPADKRFESVLHFAANHKRVDIVRIFLDNGFDVNGLYGESPRDPGLPLLSSFVGYHLLAPVRNVEERRMEGVRLLIKRGANPNIMSGKGKTPLWEATVRKDMNMVKLLLNLGADPFLGGNFTKSAFYEAFVDSSPISLEYVELFLKEGLESWYLPDFENLFELIDEIDQENESEGANGDANVIDENDANCESWDPKPTLNGLSEREWLRFLKMKRVRDLYWRTQFPPAACTRW